MSESARKVERWFEDIFTRGDLSAVDDFVAHGQGDHPGTHGVEAFKDRLRWRSS